LYNSEKWKKIDRLNRDKKVDNSSEMILIVNFTESSFSLPTGFSNSRNLSKQQKSIVNTSNASLTPAAKSMDMETTKYQLAIMNPTFTIGILQE
jgi:hypothetical protein